MTVSKGTRLGLTRWSDDTDPWDRADWDGDNAILEEEAVKFDQGIVLPDASPDTAGMFYRLVDDLGTIEQLFYSDGVTWRRVALHDGPSGIGSAAPATWDAGDLIITLRNIAGTDVTPGNLTVAYRHVDHDNTISIAATLAIGSTTTLGTVGGQLAIRGIDAPSLKANGIDLSVPVVYRDATTGDLFEGIGYNAAADSNSDLRLFARTAAGKLTAVTDSVPFAWAVGDTITVGPVALGQNV